MERISSKFEVEFNLYEDLPESISGMDYSEIEGDLILKINDEVIFNEENILVAELAYELNKWLPKSSFESFNYKSMDYEDESILKFNVASDKVELLSNWLVDGTPLPIYLNLDEVHEKISIFVEMILN